MLAGHPERVVTLLLTDVEGSTAAWDASADEMARQLEEHDAVVRQVVEGHGGRLVKSKGEGDSTFSVFEVAHAAVAAAVELQQRLGLPVRAALHAGPVQERDGDFFGPVPNTAARVRATAHGRQVLVTEAVASLCAGRLPDGVSLRPLGTFRLRDLSNPVPIHQVVHPELPDRFPPLRSVEAPGSSLPTPMTALIGREEDVRVAVKTLEQERLVTLTGLGGIGKTRLALAVAESAASAFREGVWWVELGQLAAEAAIAETVAATIGASEQRPGVSEVGGVVDRLRHDGALLVLDNCEHVLNGAAELVDVVLRECPRVKVLATSREPLGVPGETQLRVEPLAAADASAPAVRLLVERAGQPVDVDLALELCRRLDGIPLAIELAAAQVAVLGPAQLNAHLTEALVEARRRAGPERHRSLRAVLDSSYRLLDDDTARAFRALSIFPAGFSLEAAAAVLGGGAVASVTALARASLLTPEDGRFRMLEPVRHHAKELLVAAGEEAAVMEALLRWALTQPRGEREAVTAAAGWAFDTGRVEEAARLVMVRRPDWVARSWLEGQQWVRRAGAVHGDGELAPRLIALDAELTRRAADLDEAEALASRARDLAVARGDVLAEAEALGTLLAVRLMSGDVVGGEEVGANALAAARRVGDPVLLGTVLNHLGAIAATGGNFVLAAERWEESVTVLRAAGDRSSLPATLNNLSYLAYRRLDLTQARTLAESSIGYAQEAGVEGPVAFAVGILGRVAYEEGDLDEAQQLLEDALRREELLRGATGGAHAAGPLVDLLIERGELDRAEAVLEQWVSDSRRRRLMGALYAIFQSDLALCRGDVERADTWLREVADSSATAEVIVAVGLRTARLELERDPALAATLLRAVRALEEDGQPLQRREQVIRDAVAARLPVVESGAAELDVDELAALIRQRPPLVSQIQSRSGS